MQVCVNITISVIDLEQSINVLANVYINGIKEKKPSPFEVVKMVLYNLELMVVKYLHAVCVAVGRKKIGNSVTRIVERKESKAFKNRDASNSKLGAFFLFNLKGTFENL